MAHSLSIKFKRAQLTSNLRPIVNRLLSLPLHLRPRVYSMRISDTMIKDVQSKMLLLLKVINRQSNIFIDNWDFEMGKMSMAYNEAIINMFVYLQLDLAEHFVVLVAVVFCSSWCVYSTCIRGHLYAARYEFSN